MLLKIGLVLAAALAGAMLAEARAATSEPKPRDLRDVLGASHVRGLYHFGGKQDFLNEGADRLLELGCRVIKVWFMNGTETPRTMYPYNFDPAWPEPKSLVETAELPSYKALFAKPFTTFVLNVTAAGRGSYYWRTGITREQEADEERQFCELAKYLLKAYRGTGKTFVLQHHEGDWHVRGHTRREEDPTPAALENMVRWLNARQAGVSKARKEMGDCGVNVYHAAEVNLVVESMEKGRPNMVNKVLPFTKGLDLVSYSAWDSTVTFADKPEVFRKALDFIAKNMPDSPPFGARNVYLGEYGMPENDFPAKRVEAVVTNTTRTALQWGCPYVIYWQLYCNERAKDVQKKPPFKDNRDCRGFWLIRPDGSKAWAWGYFHGLLHPAGQQRGGPPPTGESR